MSAAPLAGVRVLDLADETAALAGRLLADLGAEVVLVEPPGGARVRTLAPFVGDTAGPERSTHHLYFNANKRSLVLDRTREADRARFEALVADADVLVETVPVSERAAAGLDAESLRALNPRLVHASVTPFGPDGDWRAWRGGDLVAAAAGGLVWLCGERDGPPWHGSARPASSLASLAVVTGVVAALTARARQPDAGGAHLEMALQEAATMAAIQSATPTFWTWLGMIPSRPALSNAVRCRDGGYVGLLVRPATFEPFRAWCERVGIPTRLGPEDAHFAELWAPRKDNPVSRAVLELAERLTRDEFVEGAAEAETICLPVMGFDDLARHEQFACNDQFFEVPHDGLGGPLGFVRSPVDAVTGPVAIRRAPLLGEDGARIAPRAAARPAPRHALAPYRALEGVRVLDLCWVLAGPLGTRLLGHFGADVIRVESERHIDGMRHQLGPDRKPTRELGGLFHTANAGKRSLTLDLRSEAGRALFLDLVEHADVVTENYRPGVLARMGFDAETLRARRPDLVLLHVPGTHAQGPWRDRPTTGNAVMAASGINRLMGFPGQKPRGYGVAFPDFVVPYLLATTVMAALRRRDATGEGCEMHLSQLSATIGLLGPEWMHYRETRVEPPPAANRDANHAPHGVYPARGEDAWCAVAVPDDDGWRRLCAALSRPELAADPRFATHAARKANEDALDEIVAAWTRERDRFELATELQRAGVAAAPVEHLRDTLEHDPQLRDHYQRIEHPSAPGTSIPVDREAIRFAGIPHRVRRGPLWGEHTEEIVRGLLGRSDEEYVELVLGEVLG